MVHYDLLLMGVFIRGDGIMDKIGTFILIIVIMIIVDAFSVIYTKKVIAKKPFMAATSAAITYILYAVAVIEYVDDPINIIPLALGSWIGICIWSRNR
jgi:uncharacterized protein YebE (UPF0316 family)